MGQESHSCYVIMNEKGQTYNGYTVDFVRRLRQHNSEIRGGARYTSGKGPWKYLFTVESPQFTKNTALSLEWSFKYPTNKRPRPKEFTNPAGRIESLKWVLTNPKFKEYQMTIRVLPEHYDRVIHICETLPNIKVDILPF